MKKTNLFETQTINNMCFKYEKKDIQGQIEPMFDFYRNNLEDIINSNIGNRIVNRNSLL